MSPASLPLPVSDSNFNDQLKLVPSDSAIKDKESQMPDTVNETIVKISAIALIALGAFFLLASAGLFAASIFLGPHLSLLAETMYPVGVFSLIAGIGLFRDQNRDAFRISYSKGPISLSM